MSHPRRVPRPEIPPALREQILAVILRGLYEERISRAELARRMGVSPAHVTQMLSGKRNLTMASVDEILHHINRAVIVYPYAREGWKT